MTDGWYQVTVPAVSNEPPCVGDAGFTCGIEVRFGLVHSSAPIIKWARGGQAEAVFRWVRKRGGQVTVVATQPPLKGM